MKKGQVAMEFLMTYGWAIMVVLVAIGLLAYFSVLSPDKFMPQLEYKCGCYDVDMLFSASIIEDNITYYECYNVTKYLNFETQSIEFKSITKLFYCDKDINELIEV